MNASRVTKFAFLLAVATLVVGLSACDQLVSILTSGDMPEPSEMEGGVTVGVVAPLSGQYASTYGQPILQGFELARNEINSSQVGGGGINFIAVDDMASVDGAIAAFNELIEARCRVCNPRSQVSHSKRKRRFPDCQRERCCGV